MDEDVVVTATGKSFLCTFLGVVHLAGIVYINVDMDFMEAYKVFSDPEETKVLTYKCIANGEPYERVLKGFTKFLGLENVPSDDKELLRVSLRKEFAEE